MFLALFRSFARQTVWGIIYLKVIALGSVGLYAASTDGGSVVGIVLLALTAITAFVFYLWRNEIELVARLLSVAAKSLQDNPHVITAVVFLKVCLLAVLLPLGAFIAAAYMNGEVAFNPDAGLSPSPSSNASGGKHGGSCVSTLKDSRGDEVPCCVWRTDGWASAYIALASVTALWSVMLAFEARMYTIAGVVAQWYFAAPGTTSFKGTTLSALRNAAGPSFGSLCFGSLVLTAVSVAREINRNARRDASRQGGRIAVVMCLLSSCLDCIYALIEYISKFATIQCAITGAAFCDAARSVSQLLANNFLSAYGVWWLPGTIMGAASFLLSAAYGVLVGLSSYAAWSASPASHPDAGAEAVLLGVVAFVLAAVVLQFCISVLLNVVDVVFICYAMDLDRQLSSKPEVHDVFTAVRQKRQAAAAGAVGGAGAGAVVQGPGGNIAYGRPAESRYTAPSAPPMYTGSTIDDEL